MQRVTTIHRVATKKRNVLEGTVYVTLLSAFLGTLSYLIAHCNHSL